jgi:hypothetical protein
MSEPPLDSALFRSQPSSYVSVHLKASGLFLQQPKNTRLSGKIPATRPSVMLD